MMQQPVLKGVPELRIVVFQWSAKHGECLECGLPAAFRTAAPDGVHSPDYLCAVCAANRAADGERIERIEPLE